MADELWYAVLADEEDNDWGTGSFNKKEAIEMARWMHAELIAVIDGKYDENGEPTADPICIEELYAGEDF